MFDSKLIFKTANFLAKCTELQAINESIPPEILRNYIIDLYYCINVGEIGEQLEPFTEAFEILDLAETYMKTPPIHNDWITEPKDLSTYWTWERCVQEAVWKYFEKENVGCTVCGVGK